jgi:hypothetical protein
MNWVKEREGARVRGVKSRLDQRYKNQSERIKGRGIV